MSAPALHEMPDDIFDKANDIWDHWDTHFAPENSDELVIISFIAKAIFEERQKASDLIRTATAFVEELRRMGYGETSERALPGSADPFFEALERLK